MWKPALVIDSFGQQDEVECFSEDYDTEAYHSKV